MDSSATALEKLAWYLLQCKSRAEHRAQQNIENQGYTTYLPQGFITKKRQGQHQKCLEPLFPGYLFIQLNLETANFNALRSTRGVLKFVRFGSHPTPVPCQLVENLQMAQAAQSEANQTDASQNKGLPKGTQVTILEGPFAGLEGLYEQPEGELRCYLLLDFLGKQQRLLFEEQHIQEVEG